MRIVSLLELAIGATVLPFAAQIVAAVELDPDSEASLKAAAGQYARGLLSFYKGDASEIGVFPKPPYYWWEAGAAWGGLIEYTQFTGDASYVKTITRALVANYGPNNDLLLPWRKDQEGNDDQAFWALALMSALEYDFPNPEDEKPPASYLQVVENCFDNIVPRWDLTSCNGGFKWQIYPENTYGYDYKNAISNGAVFALGARLARYTGKQSYADWAVKIWDWSKAVGLISNTYEVFDGTDDKKNCAELDHTQWTYNIGMYMHGAAVMYNYTGDQTWRKHVEGFMDHSSLFFSLNNAPDIMYEIACETPPDSCNVDQLSFKAYLSRFLAKTAIMAPFTKEQVTKWLRASALGAAKSCSGGANGATCGSRWYTGNWDGTTGVGQQLSALEVTQALLTLRKQVVPRVLPGHEVQPRPAEPIPSSTRGAVPTAAETTAKNENPKPTATPKHSEAPKPTITSAATLSLAVSGTLAVLFSIVTEIFTSQNSTTAPPRLNTTHSGFYEGRDPSSSAPSLTAAQPVPIGNNGKTLLSLPPAPPGSSPATPSVPGKDWSIRKD